GQTESSSNYVATVLPFSFTDISTTGTALTSLTGGDDVSVSIPIGFTFSLYGAANTSLFVCSNGMLNFGVSDTAYTNADLTASPTEAVIAPFWDDLHITNTSSNARVYYQVNGAPGSRQLIVQWDKVSFYPGNAADTLTFEAILNEGSNTIQFN